jgi:hypothetical protein
MGVTQREERQMRARWMTVLATGVALAAPAGAQAGGWATVELSSTPDGLAPGQAWVVDLTVLQHGRTPLEDISPKVEIAKAGGGGRQTVPARATGEPGVYQARVTFPSAGLWRYVVDDGFTQRHTYPPVRIGGAAPAVAAPPAAGDGGGGGALWPALAAALAAALLAAGLTTVLRARASRPRPGAPDGPAATES